MENARIADAAERRVPTSRVPDLPPDEKSRRVRVLFDAVAPTYDLLNTLLSFGLHRRWRVRAADLCFLKSGNNALDVATGTGDFAFELHRRVGDSGFVTGIDFSESMLRIGSRKARTRAARFRVKILPLLRGDALALPFPDGAFDAVTMGFGLRNVADIRRTLAEMSRITRPGGRVIQLELARPTHPLIRPVYTLYFERLLPWIGRLVHGHWENYAYLPASLKRFPSREEIAAMMSNAGLEDVSVMNMTFGAVTVFSGTKR